MDKTTDAFITYGYSRIYSVVCNFWVTPGAW